MLRKGEVVFGSSSAVELKGWFRSSLDTNVHPGDAGHPPSRDAITVFWQYFIIHLFLAFALVNVLFFLPLRVDSV